MTQGSVQSRWALVVALMLGLSFAGCAATSSQGKPWHRLEMYFGAMPEKEWTDFMAQSITPHFPNGLTVLEGYGQWRDPAGKLFREDSRVLIVLHPDRAVADRAAREVSTAFKARFHEESVLVVGQRAWVDFQ